MYMWASQMALAVKNLPEDAGDIRDMSLIPGWGRSLGGGGASPFYSRQAVIPTTFQVTSQPEGLPC